MTDDVPSEVKLIIFKVKCISVMYLKACRYTWLYKYVFIFWWLPLVCLNKVYTLVFSLSLVKNLCKREVMCDWRMMSVTVEYIPELTPGPSIHFPTNNAFLSREITKLLQTEKKSTFAVENDYFTKVTALAQNEDTQYDISEHCSLSFCIYSFHQYNSIFTP